MVRKPDRGEEPPEGLSPCPFCHLPGPETQLQCVSCQSIIPCDIATGEVSDGGGGGAAGGTAVAVLRSCDRCCCRCCRRRQAYDAAGLARVPQLPHARQQPALLGHPGGRGQVPHVQHGGGHAGRAAGARPAVWQGGCWSAVAVLLVFVYMSVGFPSHGRTWRQQQRVGRQARSLKNLGRGFGPNSAHFSPPNAFGKQHTTYIWFPDFFEPLWTTACMTWCPK